MDTFGPSVDAPSVIIGLGYVVLSSASDSSISDARQRSLHTGKAKVANTCLDGTGRIDTFRNEVVLRNFKVFHGEASQQPQSGKYGREEPRQSDIRAS